MNTSNHSLENRATLTSVEDKWMHKLDSIILQNMESNLLTITLLAKQMNVSERCLRYKVKALTNCPPNQYIRKIRLQKAKELLEHRAYYTVAEVCYKVGFRSPSYFSQAFKTYHGYLPSRFSLRFGAKPA